jgi:hypothetical protein
VEDVIKKGQVNTLWTLSYINTAKKYLTLFVAPGAQKRDWWNI